MCGALRSGQRTGACGHLVCHSMGIRVESCRFGEQLRGRRRRTARRSVINVAGRTNLVQRRSAAVHIVLCMRLLASPCRSAWTLGLGGLHKLHRMPTTVRSTRALRRIRGWPPVVPTLPNPPRGQLRNCRLSSPSIVESREAPSTSVGRLCRLELQAFQAQ